MWVNIIVNIFGLAAIACVIWFHWGPRKKVRASATGSTQEVAITVKGGYSPDVIVLVAGKPARLVFTRLEDNSCSEMVVFDSLDTSAKLPMGQPVDVELPALEPGEYPFGCQMGMLRGKVVVGV